jgi:hypothetical protein
MLAGTEVAARRICEVRPKSSLLGKVAVIAYVSSVNEWDFWGSPFRRFAGLAKREPERSTEN